MTGLRLIEKPDCTANECNDPKRNLADPPDTLEEAQSRAWALNQAMMSASSLSVVCCFTGRQKTAPGVGPVEHLHDT